MIRTSAIVLFLALLTRPPTAAGGSDTLSLENGIIKVALVREHGAYREEWFAGGPGEWRLVALSGSESRGPIVLGTPGGMTTVPLTDARLLGSGKDGSLELRGSASTARLTETISLSEGSPFASVGVRMETTAEMSLSGLMSTYAFAPDGRDSREYGPVDFVFTPQLRPAPDEVIADHVFRSPAFILQEGGFAAAVVPDLRTIDGKERPIRSGGDLQVAADRRPFMSFGLMNWQRKKDHVFYAHADTMLSRLGPGILTYAFFLYVNVSAPPRGAFRDIVRFQWSEYGHPNFLGAVSPQSMPFAAYIHKAWYEFLPTVALDTAYRGIPVTLLRQGRLAWSNHLHPGADNDCWFNVWFNALRTAYGMHVYGRAAGDTLLVQRSERVLNLALLAPRAGGLAPTIFYIDSAGGHWVADHGWGG
ncbi:MAG TPA: hypothetical protein VF514_08700 [Bacteroidota bacterium]